MFPSFWGEDYYLLNVKDYRYSKIQLVRFPLGKVNRKWASAR